MHRRIMDRLRPTESIEFGAGASRGQWTMPFDPHAVLLIAHSSPAFDELSGHRFIVGVLQAHRIAAISLSVTGPDHRAPRRVTPGQRIAMALEWVARSPALADRPVALFGMAAAVPDCIAAAALHGPAAIRSLLVLDGRPDLAAADLARLRVPTLLMVGNADALTLAVYRTVARATHAPHRLELLHRATQPRADPGAHEAIACAATRWVLDTTQRRASARAASAGV